MDYIKAWECIGCGRLEAQQTCLGVCQDRPVKLVYASTYEEALEQIHSVRARLERLEAFARALARTSPRPGQWESSYRAAQKQARELLLP